MRKWTSRTDLYIAFSREILLKGDKERSFPNAIDLNEIEFRPHDTDDSGVGVSRLPLDSADR